jgi:hypothetical protein
MGKLWGATLSALALALSIVKMIQFGPRAGSISRKGSEKCGFARRPCATSMPTIFDRKQVF